MCVCVRERELVVREGCIYFPYAVGSGGDESDRKDPLNSDCVSVRVCVCACVCVCV